MTPPLDRVPDLAFLFEASRRLNRALELDHLLAEIRSLCLEAVDGEAVNVLIWDDDRTRLEFQLAFNRSDDEVRRLYLEPNEGLAGWIAANDRPVIVNDLTRDLRYKHEIDRAVGFTGHSVLGVPVHRGRSVVGVVEILNKRGPDGFTETDLRILTALADPIAVALENALLYRGLEREKAENEILFRIGLKLNQTVDLGETLDRILDLIGEVLAYDGAGISLLQPESAEIGLISVRGYPPGAEEGFRLKVGEGAVGWVVKTGEPLLIPDVGKDRRYVVIRPSTRSQLTVPMITEGRVVGAVNLENDSLDAYRPRDMRPLLTFASQAAISVERARLHEEVMRRRRLQHEVDLARRIQESFLPSADPDLPGVRISGRTIPSLEVGGDCYDYIRIAEDQFGVIVADVAGKGIPAALILATFRAAMRTEVRHQYEIWRILQNVNRLLRESIRPEQFVTAFYGVLDLRKRVFTYANAGHNPPALLRAAGGVEWLEAGGLILGSFEEVRHEVGRVVLEPGDEVILYTDGAVEASNDAGEEFGLGRLVDAIRSAAGAGAAGVRRHLEEEVLRHCEGKAQDDITLVVMRVEETGASTGGRVQG